MDKATKIKTKYTTIKKEANERFLRIWATTEALSIGHGGVSTVSEATGIARSRIARGKKEILLGGTLEESRIRKKGGWKKTIRTN